MRCLLTAIGWLHYNRIIHQDIKPNNFLYDKARKTGKLADMGLASYLSDAHGLTDDPSKTGFLRTKTWADTFFPAIPHAATNADGGAKRRQKTTDYPPPKQHTGTAGYRAIEILLRCDIVSTATDVYSAG